MIAAPVTSDDIYARLKERYCLADGWITMGEVQPLGCQRRFDALSIMGWGSRGFEALGREATPAEVSRAREAAYKDGYDAGQRAGKQGATRASEDLATLRRTVAAAEKATGVILQEWMDFPTLGMAMKMLRGSRLPYLSQDMEKAAAALRALADLLPAPTMEAAE